MNENIIKMLEMLSRDEEAQKKLAATRDPDEAYAIVSEIHGGYTKEEFVEAMKAINDKINQDLTDGELAQTAGGNVTAAIIELTQPGGGPDYGTEAIVMIPLSITAASAVSYTLGVAASAV